MNKIALLCVLCLLTLPIHVAHSVENFKATPAATSNDFKNVDDLFKTLIQSGQLLPFVESDIKKWQLTPFVTNDRNVVLLNIKSTEKSYFATFVGEKVKGTWNVKFAYLSDVPVSPVYVIDMLFSARMMASLQTGEEAVPKNIYLQNKNYSPNKVSAFVLTFYDKDRSVNVEGELIPDGKGGAFFNLKQKGKGKQ